MKWLFPAAMFASSLLLLAAAYRTQPRRPAVAVVHHERLLEADPVAAGLARVESDRAKLQTRRGQAAGLIIRNRADIEQFLAADRPDLDAGLAASRGLYHDFLAGSMDVSLAAAHREAQQEFAQYAEARYREMLNGMDKALESLEKETMVEPLREERLRLLNLRLALDALTRDRIALSPLRIEQISSEIQALQFVLEIKQRRGQRLFSIKEKRAFDELRNTTHAGTDERARDIDARLNELIGSMERNARELTAGYEAGQNRARAGALERRRAMLQAAEDMYKRAPRARPGSAQSSGALEQYLDLFYDTLRARAAAAAVDAGAFLVLDAPLYAAPGVKDVTADLGLPVSRAAGGKP